MGFGLGIGMIALGLILALAVEDAIAGVDLTMVGWILTVVGIVALGFAAAQMSSRRSTGNVSTTTHPDGSQTVSERRTDAGPTL